MLCDRNAGSPPRTGPGCATGSAARRGIRWVSLHSNPPLEVGGDLPPCPRWDCCRFDALRGIGFGKSGGVSKVSMGAISLSLAFPSLPLADRRLGDKELIGKFPLGEPQLLPAAADIRAKGLFAFHIQTSSFAAGVCLAGSLSPYGPGDKIASLWRHFPTRPLGRSLFCKGFPAVGAQRLAFRMPMRYGSRCLAGHIRKRMPAR